MKTRLIISAFILFSLQGYSQSKNTLSAVYGTGSNDINIKGVVGDFGYHSARGTLFGLNYSRNFTPSFSIETGLIFSDNKVRETSISPGGSTERNGTIKMTSIPAIAKITFLKYLYVDAGLTADFQTSNTSPAPNQSGIGIEGGIGAKYSFGSLLLFVNPFIHDHALIRFNAGSTFNMIGSGVKFGVGYNF